MKSDEEKSNIEKLREQAEKLRVDKAKQEAVEGKNKEAALATLANMKAVQEDSQLAQMYRDSAGVGAANLGGELPLLKIHAQGRSHTNQLADGSEPNDGWFFYKPTGEQFPEVTCHILTISRGFRAKALEEGKKDVFNQIMAGIVIDGDNYERPFMMYLTGLKLSPMWEFGKEAAKYTKAKPYPIPMFALSVKLTKEKVKTDFGFSWIANFEILKEEDGSPRVILDPGLFQFLKDRVEMVEETIAKLIESKTSQQQAETISEEREPF